MTQTALLAHARSSKRLRRRLLTPRDVPVWDPQKGMRAFMEAPRTSLHSFPGRLEVSRRHARPIPIRRIVFCSSEGGLCLWKYDPSKPQSDPQMRTHSFKSSVQRMRVHTTGVGTTRIMPLSAPTNRTPAYLSLHPYNRRLLLCMHASNPAPTQPPHASCLSLHTTQPPHASCLSLNLHPHNHLHNHASNPAHHITICITMPLSLHTTQPSAVAHARNPIPEGFCSFGGKENYFRTWDIAAEKYTFRSGGGHRG